MTSHNHHMYPPSSSSSPTAPKAAVQPNGLTRYGSAPGAFLSGVVDSVVGADREFSVLGSPSTSVVVGHAQYFSGDSSSLTSDSSCKVNSSNDPKPPKTGLQRSYGLNEIAHCAGSLVRQKSSPAGFLSQYVASENGFSITRGTGGCNNNGHAVSRLNSQLSFTRQESISEVSENGMEDMSSCENGHQTSYPHSNTTATTTTSSFVLDSWDNATTPTSIVFSGPSTKRPKNNMDGDFYNCLNALESQFSLPQTTLEMAAVEKLLNIPEDSVPCKVRAKRGCATHPRSIAERERRTRISGKLKKLQELVPNMDKQTSYADMLDLAAQHIKGLQNEVQKLHKELEGCTCGCKP